MILRNSLARAALVLLLLGLTGASASAASYPRVDAALNADKSAVIVTGSNTDANNYSCMASARIRVSGQSAFSKLECTFSLPANAAERQLCQQAGTGPNSLTSVEGVKFTCVPN